MFERGRQARNFTTNVPKNLVIKSSSEQIFFPKIAVGCPWYIPSPKGYTHKTRFACDRNLNDKIKFKKRKEKKKEENRRKRKKNYKITGTKLRWRFMETFGVRCPRPLISFYYRDATFSTLTSFYCRDATFSTLISFYGS